MPRRLHTRIVLAQLRAAGPIKPRRRVGRIPRPAEPKTIALEYRKAIVRAVCERARAAFERERGAIVEALIDLRRAQERDEKPVPRADAPGAAIGLGVASDLGAKAARLIDRAAAAFTNELRPAALYDLVKQFGRRTSEHARRQFDQQLRSAIGIPLSAIERPSRDRIEGWAAENVDLISTVGERYFERLRGDVEEAFSSGMHPATFADLLEERYEMSANDAERVARDQTLKLSANLTHDRMEGLGVEFARWRTVGDGRVCEDCEARNGKRFKLSEGLDGVMPGFCHPSDRCYSEPDLSALIDG